jgi:NADH-quinone oxidoreductase subunit M
MSPTYAAVAGLGILIGVAYTLRALQLAFFSDHAEQNSGSPAPATVASNGHEKLEPISVPERFGAMLLIGASLVIGLYPSLLLNRIVPSFSSPLFDGLRKVGGLP